MLEGEGACDHDEEHHARGPDVSVEAVILFPQKHFGCGVTGRPTGCLEGLPVVVEVAQAEVDQLYRPVSVQQQVLWLQVAVHHSDLVNVFDAVDQLVEVLARLLFCQSRLLSDRLI